MLGKDEEEGDEDNEVMLDASLHGVLTVLVGTTTKSAVAIESVDELSAFFPLVDNLMTAPGVNSFVADVTSDPDDGRRFTDPMIREEGVVGSLAWPEIVDAATVTLNDLIV